jgi:capsular exopolysaccharide synthesis family protein
MMVADSPDLAPAPASDDGIAEELVSLVAPASYAADQYLSLRNIVERLRNESGFRVLAITSPTPGDGKTVTALNVAGSLAQAPDARVLLIDADLRRPSVTEYLPIGGTRVRGLVDAIVEPRLALGDVVQRVERLNLHVLPAGFAQCGTYELLTSPRVEALLAEARAQFDYVLVDTPPLLPVPDSRLVGRCADGFLVIVAAEKTPRHMLAEALNLLDPAKVIGLVFNLDDRAASGYQNYYGYGYGRHSQSARQRRAWWQLW